MRSSSEDSNLWCGVRTSTVVEKGQVEYVPASAPALIVTGPSSLPAPSGKAKRRKVSRSPLKLARRFEIPRYTETPRKKSAIEDQSFSAALSRQQSRGKSSRTGRDPRVGAVFQMGLP